MAPHIGYKRIYESITGQRHYPITLIAMFFILLIGYFIAWPIMMTDTDLWYHLSGGRYFWQNGTIAHDAFFSYIAPPKSWYNYYWLFQAVIYKVFEWTGYYGLIGLRCILYFLTALFICLSFVRRHENRTELLLVLFLFVACASVILYRELLVRPHLFSYLFIVVFLYILEFKRDKIWLLPILGILWSNIHGIEYPVMYLIIFAYLAEIYWRQLRKIPTGAKSRRKENWFLIATFYSIFITPGVIELILIPFSVAFQNAVYQNLYVSELHPIPFRNFFVFAPVSIQGLISSLQNIIVMLAAASGLIGLWKKKLRISHAIIFVGAIVLLAQHVRFACEFTLLSIPLLRHGAHLIAEKDRIPRLVATLALPVVVVLLPLLVFQSAMGNRPAYPFAQVNLPTGVVRFLNQHAPNGGKILNEVNTGGYLPWALNQQFKIYMDMQMTIFSDTDFATAQTAFFDANAFEAFIKSYDPSFISVSLNRPYFKQIVASDKRFVPIFFDQAELLYVNKLHHAELAGRYALKTLDPFRFREIIYEDLGEDMLTPMFAEAARIRDDDPANYSANYILGIISVVRKQYNQAISHAETIMRNYPDLSHGYALKGDALFGMERYEDAAVLYEKALDMGQTAKTEKVYWNLHAAYAQSKKYKKAYRVLSKYVNPFSPNEDYKEIYQLGVSAATVGKIREAFTFLKIARMRVPRTDTEHIEKIERNLSILSGDLK